METWGAQGGGTSSCGGKGGYSYGYLRLKKRMTIYAYVGQMGKTNGASGSPATFNGGGSSGSGYSQYKGGGSGGGATDFRLKNGNWNLKESLDSRVLVAGGGGGCYNLNGGTAGYGGGESGGDGIGVTTAKGATQTTGNAFGYGGNGRNGAGYNSAFEGDGGGGGGWY